MTTSENNYCFEDLSFAVPVSVAADIRNATLFAVFWRSGLLRVDVTFLAMVNAR